VKLLNNYNLTPLKHHSKFVSQLFLFGIRPVFNIIRSISHWLLQTLLPRLSILT